jgi:hypothetical protein
VHTGRGQRRTARGSAFAALAVVALLGAVWLWPSAGNAARGPLGPGATVTYHYGRVDVATASRDGWTVTVDHRYATFQVFDAPKLPVTYAVPMPPRLWRSIATRAARITTLRPSNASGCAHATSRMVHVVDDGEVLIDRQFDVCDGNVAIARTLDAFLAPVAALLPELSGGGAAAPSSRV